MDNSYGYNYGGGSVIGTILYFAVLIFGVYIMWRIFSKAGKPGWAAIIPIYNIIVLLEIVGKPWWWLLLLFIPFVNIVILILVMIQLAKVFGKSGGFAVGLILLSIVFMAILAFDNSTYLGPNVA